MAANSLRAVFMNRVSAARQYSNTRSGKERVYAMATAKVNKYERENPWYEARLSGFLAVPSGAR
ncbi:hypothetical protein CR152_27255 [Massilia violaceinigra]|uniref:Uncharacterized protein n=1 Tax=Massilia violaceinigra TaxID=2045208 RepID=A0A2D2DS33_9BURK|nr:hypothetical protein CR152_27255 [Massilia violaceinigra]